MRMDHCNGVAPLNSFGSEDDLAGAAARHAEIETNVVTPTKKLRRRTVDVFMANLFQGSGHDALPSPTVQRHHTQN
jgi:hypothetical protein